MPLTVCALRKPEGEGTKDIESEVPKKKKTKTKNLLAWNLRKADKEE